MIVPQNKEIRLKYFFSEKIAGAWGNDPTEDNSIVCIRAADFETEKISHKKNELTKRSFTKDEIEKRQLLEGDLIIEKSGGGENQPVGRVVKFFLNETALCSNFLEILRPDQKIILPAFAAYVCYSIWSTRKVIPSIKQTTGIQNLDLSDYLNIKFKVPELAIQKKIVESLDHETNHIDNLISAKEQQLKLLAEKKQTIISKAIVRGTDSNAKMKYSQIEWIGNIPQHWKVVRTKWILKERNERSRYGEEELLTVSHITGVTLRSEKDVNMFEAESTIGYKIAHKNDLVINTLWAWMGAMGVSPTDGIVSPAYHVYEPSEEIEPDYVNAIVSTPAFIAEVTRYSKGVWSSRLRLYPDGLYEVMIPLPPIDEQLLIISHIKSQTEKLDLMKMTTERSIELLRERRAVLISAAIDGRTIK